MTLSVASGFPYYISLTSEKTYRADFESEKTFHFFNEIGEEKSSFRYAPGKWSIKQILGHITDHERIMSYRALRVSRKDHTQLAGYDQDLFVENGRFDHRSWKDLVDDYKNVRNSTLCLMNSFSNEQLKYRGLVWKYELPVQDLLMATIGHEIHHMKVIRERYF